jgi:hypothetical protein
MHTVLSGSRDGSVGIETGYGLNNLTIGVPVPIQLRISLSSSRSGKFHRPPNLSNSVKLK